MMLIGERGVRLNLMQKWDMNKLYKDELRKARPNADRS